MISKRLHPASFSNVNAQLAQIVPYKVLTTRGDIIVRGATGPQRLAKGALGTYLAAGGTDPVWVAGSLNDETCSVYISAAQSIISNEWNVFIYYDLEHYDASGLHRPTVTPERITIAKSGIYLIAAYVEFEFNATGIRFSSVKADGADVIVSGQDAVSATYGTYLSYSGMARLTAGQYLRLQAYQNSGSALNVTNSKLTIVRIAP